MHLPYKKHFVSLGSAFVILILLLITALLVSYSRHSQTNESHADTTFQSTTYLPGSVPGCQFQKADPGFNVAFCDTFDQAMPTANRSGDLDGTVWGASRVVSNAEGGDNFQSGTNIGSGDGLADAFAQVQINRCGTTLTVLPDSDILNCNGLIAEAVNDDGGQTILAMYPKQPFDISGRTGTVVFDVSADSQGPHAAWPTFMYTDQPVPAPYGLTQGGVFTTMEPAPRNGFGFNIDDQPTDCTASAPICKSAHHSGIADMYAISNYVPRNLDFTRVNDVITSGAGQMNHFEVRISTNRVEIWGTDAGSNTLKELAYDANPGLTLTRGVVWMEDVHYNANKFNSQQTHTFDWDNFGFDGPVLPRDLTFDVPENGKVAGGAEQLGWGNATLTVPNVTNTAAATAAILTMNWWPEAKDTITLQVNGNPAITQPWVFDSNTFVWRTIAIPVPLSQIHDGNNTVSIKTGDGAAIANVDIILLGAGGMPSCYDPSNCAASQFSGGTVTPALTAMPTIVPTNSPTPTSKPGVTITPTPSQKPTPTTISGSINDTWVFYGDSVTVETMTLGDPTFAQLIHTALPNVTINEVNEGMSGENIDSGVSDIDGVLSRNPNAQYVTVSLGTNNTVGGGGTICYTAPADFYSDAVLIINKILAAGKIPVMPTIPSAYQQNCAAPIDAQIQLLYQNIPQLMKGPDLWTVFNNFNGTDPFPGIHPDQAQMNDYNKVWATWAEQNIYSNTSNPTPTTKPASTPIPTTRPTNTPIPTVTPTTAPNSAKLALTIGLDGIGKAGDNVSRGTTGNTSPVHSSRTVTLNLSDQNNNPLPLITGQITYDTTSGLFKGTISLPSTVTTGFYTLKISSPSFLQRAIPAILSITQGQTATIPTTYLTAGDINNDGQIGLLDYNQLLSCFGSTSQSCAPSDFDDDGTIGGADYNLFLRELSVQNGG